MRNPQRGIHAPLTNGVRKVRDDEMGALQMIGPGAITIFEEQLKDDSFRHFLQHEAEADGVEVYCRLVPFEAPEPVVTAYRLVALAKEHPWIRGWVPASEPNQWSRHSWREIRDWIDDLYEQVRVQRSTQQVPLTLYFPPLAQDMGGDRDHRIGWEELRSPIGRFLEGGDGFAWYSYWHALDHKRLAESDMPHWLWTALEEPPVRAKTLIVEAGRFYQEPLGIDGSYGDEIIERFGSRVRRLPSASMAHAVTFWLLGSAMPDFQHQAWIDEEGYRKDIVDYIVEFGP